MRRGRVDHDRAEARRGGGEQRPQARARQRLERVGGSPAGGEHGEVLGALRQAQLAAGEEIGEATVRQPQLAVQARGAQVAIDQQRAHTERSEAACQLEREPSASLLARGADDRQQAPPAEPVREELLGLRPVQFRTQRPRCEERRPGSVFLGRWIAVRVCILNRGNWAPEINDILTVPATDPSIRQCEIE